MFEMIAIGSDHAGFPLKEEIRKYLDEKGIAYKDFGTYSTDRADYPKYGAIVAHAVASGEYEKGILVCGTGIGISIAANKVKGIRADVYKRQSSGHLALYNYFFNNNQGETLFTIILHIGTLIAVCIVYYKTIWQLIIEFFDLI